VAWNKYQCSITSNNAISPDGTQNADKLTLSGSTGTYTGLVFRVASPLANSIYMKNDSIGSGKFIIQVDGVGSAKWNSDGTLSSVTGGTTTNAESVGNGWFRFTYVVTSGAYINFGIENGTTGNSIYIWGAQVEAGAYATSYIPTLGTSVTRVADAASKTGISSLIGQTEGTVFIEYQKPSGLDTDNILFSLSDGTSANLTYVSTQGIFEFITASATQAVKVGISFISGTNKIAIYYKANDFGVYLNGVNIFTDTAGSVGAMSKFSLGCYFNNNFPVGTTISQALLFKTRLTNAQLAELTTI
jgi:hypothetical protein